MKVHIITPFAQDKNLGKCYNEAMRNIPDGDAACIKDIDVLFLTSDAGNIIHNYANGLLNGDIQQTGIITCYTNRIYPKGIYQLLSGKVSEETDIKTHIRLAEEQKKHLYEATELHKVVSGFLMIISKKVWNQIKFSELGKCLAVDHDYSKRILDAGKKIYRMDGLYVFHIYRMMQGITNTNHLK